MFGWQRRTETREQVREELSAAADRHARAVLADAMSQIDLRLAKDREDRTHSEVSTQTAIESLRFAVMDKNSDVGPMLAQVAEMCALVAERIEADRLERRALTEAITMLARASAIPLTAAPTDAPPRVIGGTVLASSEPPDVIDLVEPDPLRDIDSDIDIDIDIDAQDLVDLRDHVDVQEPARIQEPARTQEPVEVEEPVEVQELPAHVAYSEDRAELMDLIAAYVPQASAPQASAPPPSAPEPSRPEPSEEVPSAPETDVGRDIWDAVEKEREERSWLADIDLRPRHGTRLTARRSNAPV